jgi:hypothetical protein
MGWILSMELVSILGGGVLLFCRKLFDGGLQ